MNDCSVRQFRFIFAALILLMGCSLTAPPAPSPVATAVLPTLHLPTPLPSQSPPPAPSPTLAAAATVAPVQSPEPTAVPPTEAAAPTATVAAVRPGVSLLSSSGGQSIGRSLQGRPIVAYRFGHGPSHLLFIGGIHGGYEWNTITLAYEAIDYFTAQPEQIPENITLHIIPSANPDGQYLVTQQTGRFTTADVFSDTVPGRFNANGVDLNRNWDCEWAATAVWRNQAVSGGDQPFSEPETVALRDYILAQQPAAVVFWHSAANGVFAAGCPGIEPRSLALAQLYGRAASYPVYERFSAYAITGDAGDWLATQNIPSISVELVNHEADDWPQNLAGMQALLQHFAAEPKPP